MSKYIVFSFFFYIALYLPAFLYGAESLDEAVELGEQEKQMQVSPPDAVVEDENSEFYNHQRIFCIEYWNEYYKKMKKANIEVSSRGKYDEVVVFNCPDCSLEEHYVEPFLNTEVDGLTGFDRIRECGFTKAVFKGSKGLREIEREIN